MLSIKKKLDQISPSFCAAKWLQVTVRLQNGQTHSCHHPTTHTVPLRELQKNPSALHNTQKKMNTRKQMLKGERPSECSYCWKIEDLPGQQMSDRHYKSGQDWSAPYLDETAQLPWNADVVPKYLEVSFSNICNFKCAYCFPDVSSKWMSESLEHGPYPTSDYFGGLVYLKKAGRMPLPESKNEYLKAFWQWLPKISPQLHELRVTGGEPLLSSDCFRLLDFLNEFPNPKLNLAINTNLGVPTPLVRKILEKLSQLQAQKKIKSANIFTSLDTWGPQAEYIRSGLKLELWKTNLDLCLSFSANVKSHLMVTYNILSLFRFGELLQFVLEKKSQSQGQFDLDISILHDPAFLDFRLLPEDLKSQMDHDLEFMRQNSSDKIAYGFYPFEIEKMKRLVELSKVPLESKNLKARRIDFACFIQEYDRRKNLNFSATFPELKSSLEAWAGLAERRSLAEKSFQNTARKLQKWLGSKLVPEQGSQ